MKSIDLFGVALLLYLSGALITLIISRWRRAVGLVALVVTAAASSILFWVALQALFTGPVATSAPLWTLPGLNASLIIRIDMMSAIFLIAISIMSLLVTLYALPFMRMPFYQNDHLGAFYPVLLVFFAGVTMVVSVADMFFFFIFWEVMTLASYLMVVFKRDERDRVRAGYKYFLITHIATALIFIAAIIVYRHAGSFSFVALTQGMHALGLSQPWLMHLVLAFFFLGFATKAGILPMGDWLPDAYPAAPTPATVAFAGTMTKLGVYGILRVFCQFTPIGGYTDVWGVVIALFGTISIFVGTMTALVQEDSKRLLSFHVIGQMGYMFLGIGVGVFFLRTQPILGAVAITGGIFHLINNVCYKSSLFFNSGAVFYKVGTRNLNLVGGLSKLMPLTAGTALIASLSIAGVPPFNGFSSKWLIYQAAIRGGMGVPLFMVLAIVAIFISAVTLASFIKFFSTLFYGKLADAGSGAKAGEVPFCMLVPQVLLAAFCVLLGLLPLWPAQIIYKGLQQMLPVDLVPAPTMVLGANSVGGFFLDFGHGPAAGWNPMVVMLVGLICGIIAYTLYRSARAPRRVDDTWYCGEVHSDEEVRYRAHSYYLAFKSMFSLSMGKYQRPGVYPSITYPKITFKEGDRGKRLLNIDKWLYEPLVRWIMKWINRFSTTHSGIPHVYLLWLLMGVIAAVGILFWLSQ
jgi:hydrogenase-4 component B